MTAISILLLLCLIQPLSGQVKGKIVDAATGEGVEKAMIISGAKGAVSGSDGTFVTDASEYLSVEAAGYATLVVKADTLKPMHIRINPLSYDLSEVSVTAYHTPGKLKSLPGAVSIIDPGPSRELEHNLVSPLSSAPGVYVQEASPGTMKLTLRGIGSRYPYGTKKIKLYLDEIPLYSAEGETYFDDINPEFISRMEVLRGPASGIYGASLGGAVLLYPERPGYGKTEAWLSNSAGSFGYLKNSAGFMGGTFNRDIHLSVARIQSDGFRQNDEYLRKSFMLNYHRRFSEKLNGNLLLSGSSVNAQIPSSIDSATLVSNPTAAAPSWLKTRGSKDPERILAGLKLNYRPSETVDLTGSLFGTYRTNEENRPFNFLNETGSSYGVRLLARYSGKIRNSSYRLVAGSNLFFEKYKSSISGNPGGLGLKGDLMQKGRQFIYQADVFAQAEWRFAAFSLTAGVDVNASGFTFRDLYSSDTLDQSGYYDFQPVTSPRLAFSWDPSNAVSVYAAINHGFTIPSLSETQTPLGLINRDIKPEKAWSFEAGNRLSLFEGATFVDLAMYYMRVSKLIVPQRVAEDFYVGMNAGASLHRGIEIAVQQRLFGTMDPQEPSPFAAAANLSYSINRFSFQDFTLDGNDFSGNRLPGMPAQFFTGSVELRAFKGFSSEWEFSSSGKIPLDDFNRRYAESWTVLNAGAGYAFEIGKKLEISALLKINNITNTRYASMVVVNAPGTETSPPRYYYPGMPRWFSVGVRVGVWGSGGAVEW
jgi:iron complex outermembrane receptor protein